MAAHRYWRLYITGTATAGNRKSIAKLEFYDDVTWGTDLSGLGTATGSSQYNASYAPSKAFDADVASSWTTANQWANPEWLAYDFGVGGEVDVRSVAITARQTYFYLENPTVFDVQYSDNGTDWVTEWSVNDPSFITYERRLFRNLAYVVIEDRGRSTRERYSLSFINDSAFKGTLGRARFAFPKPNNSVFKGTSGRVRHIVHRIQVYEVAGEVHVSGIAAAWREVCLFSRASGALVAVTMSNGLGNFAFANVAYAPMGYFAVAFDVGSVVAKNAEGVNLITPTLVE